MSVKPVAWMMLVPEDERERAAISNVKYIDHHTKIAMNGLYPELSKHYRTPLYDAPAPELAEALRTYIAHYPAFRSKPVGAPGSQAREKQEYEIALEDEAISLLARITPK